MQPNTIHEWQDLIRRRRLTIIRVAIVAFGVVLIGTLLWPPTYESSSMILVQDNRAQLLVSPAVQDNSPNRPTVVANPVTEQDLTPLMGFYKAIPRDLEDAAMIDGLSRLGAFVKVVMPLSLAGIFTVVIFAFTLVTQEFVYGLTFITASRSYTVSVGVPTFLVRGDVYFWGSMMAACLITSVPIAIIYNLFVDRFVAGFTGGALK